MDEIVSIDFKQELTAVVEKVVLEATGRIITIDSETLLIQKGFLDSFSMVNLVLYVQNTYGITVDVTEITEENFGTAERISVFIAKRRTDVS